MSRPSDKTYSAMNLEAAFLRGAVENRPRSLRFQEISSRELATIAHLQHAGPDVTVRQPGLISPELPDGSVVFLGMVEYAKQLKQSGIAVITTRELEDQVPTGCARLITEADPKGTWSEILSIFEGRRELFPGYVSQSAKVHPTAVVGEGVFIGDEVTIGPNVVLFGPLYVGKSAVIVANTVIGGEGFERVKTAGGWTLACHLGGVWIADRVHVKAGCNIDKGLTGDFTFIGRESLIDSLVHIAHSVTIGERCTITACAEISGSVVVGNDVWIGPNSSITNGVSIGNDSLIGIGAVVTRSVEQNSVVVGPGVVAGERCHCGRRYARGSRPTTCVCGATTLSEEI